MLKIGVFGVGHLGKIHLKCIRELTNMYDLVGFYDPNDVVAKKVADEFQIKAFDTPESLLQAIDVADIVAPTPAHYGLAELAIQQNKHVFIEKPLTHTLAEAEQLIVLQKKHPVHVQIGHVERFNPAFLAVSEVALEPMFVEAHRLAMFNPRGTDVSVVLDLMIHDLDIVLSLVQHEVRQVHASGVAVVSDTPDIANARVEFANGCVANFTASRMSLKNMRKVRLFQKDAYISMDFLNKSTDIVRLFDAENTDPQQRADLAELDTGTGKKYLQFQQAKTKPVNAIQMELRTFAESIRTGEPPKVGLQEGYRALKLAYRILDKIDGGRRTVDGGRWTVNDGR